MFLTFLLAALPSLSGVWITDAEMARQTPRPYEARQFQTKKLPPVNRSLQNRHILFRKVFELDAVKTATLRITADDYYKLYVNGAFVGMGPAAGTTACTYYNEFDVTGFLRKGRNVIAVHTFYQGLVNRVWVSGDNRHGLILDLHADGRKVLASDASFKTARHTGYSALGIVGYDTQFMERYDAAAPEVGFEQPGFDDSGWVPATPHPLGGDYTLVPQPTPSVIVEPIRPVSVKWRDARRVQIDFGGIYVGGLTFAAKGTKGDTIQILCGQELAEDGSVRHKMRCNCDYVEEFVLSGNAHDVLRQYDYKSFRYAELVLPPGVVFDRQSVVLEARHLPFVLKAHPNFTDPRLEPVWRLCVESFRFGTQEQPMDCMDREKGYYLGDGCYTTLAWCVLTGDWSLARKFFDDFLRTKRIDRGLITCANCAFIQEIAEYPMMMFLFAKWYLDLTGDADFIRARIPAFADVLDSYRERYARADGLLQNLDKWCVVEWPKNYQDGYDADLRDWRVCTDLHNAINAWYIGAVLCLNELSVRTGGKPYADAAPLKEAFRKVFYDRELHLFRDREGSSHISMPANVFATFFRLAPESDAAAHHAAFLKMVREKNFSTINMFQYFPLFAYLRTTGETELLHELFVSPEAWLRILREGGTRSFEGWGKDAKWNTSLFHITTAAACIFLCEEGTRVQAYTGEAKPLTADEEAALRWIDHITGTLPADKEQDWWKIGGTQHGLFAKRYNIAFAGYAAAALGMRGDGAQRAAVGRILGNCLSRYLKRDVWAYSQSKNYWGQKPWAPDPCYRENVMYTGHLLQLLALYETFTGDVRYWKDGFDFVWKDGRKVHYTVQKLIDVTVEQMRASPTGGVCCEPGLMFFPCNNHPHYALSLFARLGHGDWSADARRWEKWALAHYRKPLLGGGALNLVSHAKSGIFYPRGSAGLDAWSILWYEPWATDRKEVLSLWREAAAKIDWEVFANPADAIIGCEQTCCNPAKVPPTVEASFLAAAARACGDSATAERLEKPLDARSLVRKEGLFYLDLNREWRIGATANRILALAFSNGSSFRSLRDKWGP